MKNIKKMYLGIFLTFLLTIGLLNGLPVNENTYAQEDGIVSEEVVTEEVLGKNEYDIDDSAYATLNEVQRATLDQIENAPKSEIKAPKMKMGIVSGAFLFKDGTPSFTAGSGIDGNDNSENNQIVRSYDNIVYQVDFGFNGVEATDLVVEATVPANQGEDGWYEWDTVIMGLLGYDVEVSEDGRTLKIFFDKYEVGQGSSVKIPLAVYGALNGSIVEPTFKVYVANEEAKPENIMGVLPVTVSAKASVNVQIPQSSLSELSRGGELVDDDYYTYTYMFVPLQVSLASAGGKGSEVTSGDIAFDVDIESYIVDGSSVTEAGVESDGTKYSTTTELVDYGLVNAPSNSDRYPIIGLNDQTGAVENFALAGNVALGKTPYYSVYDSGVMSATQTGDTVSVKFENPTHDIHNNKTNSAEMSRKEIAFISGGLVVKVKGKVLGVGYNIAVDAKVSALTEGYSSSGSSIAGQNMYTDDDEVWGFALVSNPVRASYPHIQDIDTDSATGYKVLSPGMKFRYIGTDKISSLYVNESKFVSVMNFDPRAMEIDSEYIYNLSDGHYANGFSHDVYGPGVYDVSSYYNENAFEYEYGVSSDCSEEAIVARKGLKDVPQSTTNPYDNITWFDTLEAAKAAETGAETGEDGIIHGNKLCVARITFEPGRMTANEINIITNYNMKVKNNGYTRSIIDTGMTSMITTYSIGYNKVYDYSTQTGGYYEQGAGFRGRGGYETTQESWKKYVKPIYDAEGNHINAAESNHSSCGRGNVFRLTGYDISISKDVTNDDGSALSKDNTLVPRLDNTVKWTLYPTTSGGDFALGEESPATVTDTLPAGLKLDESSITPKPESVVYNDDGTTTMTWKYYNVVIGQPLDQISYITEIDRFSKDGMTYTNEVEMTLEDKSASDSDSIRVLDDSNFILEKTVDNNFIEKDEEINYTLTFQNRGTKDEDVVVYDILPYNGDNDISKVEIGNRTSAFNGTFEVTSHSTDASDYEVIYSFDENIKTHTLDEATFKTEEEWGSEFDLSKVTVIGYKINGFKPQATNKINISIKTNGNKTYDVYENNYSLWFTSELNGQPVQIPLNSNTVKTEVLSRAITGTTWVDENIDGLRQDTEELLPHVPVMLYVYNASGKAVPYTNDDGEEYKTTTDDNGFYEFSELKPGVYVVVFDIALYGDQEQHLTVDSSHDYTLNSDAKWIEVDMGKFAIIDTINLTEMPEVVPGDLETYIDASNHNDAGVIPLETGLIEDTVNVDPLPEVELTKTGMTYFGSIIAMLLLGLIVIARMIFNKKNFSK